MSYTARPPFTGGMSNQNQQQQQGGQQNNANIGASGIPNMPMINNAASIPGNHLGNPSGSTGMSVIDQKIFQQQLLLQRQLLLQGQQFQQQQQTQQNQQAKFQQQPNQTSLNRIMSEMLNVNEKNGSNVAQQTQLQQFVQLQALSSMMQLQAAQQKSFQQQSVPLPTNTTITPVARQNMQSMQKQPVNYPRTNVQNKNSPSNVISSPMQSRKSFPNAPKSTVPPMQSGMVATPLNISSGSSKSTLPQMPSAMTSVSATNTPKGYADILAASLSNSQPSMNITPSLTITKTSSPSSSTASAKGGVGLSNKSQSSNASSQKSFLSEAIQMSLGNVPMPVGKASQPPSVTVTPTNKPTVSPTNKAIPITPQKMNAPQQVPGLQKLSPTSPRTKQTPRKNTNPIRTTSLSPATQTSLQSAVPQTDTKVTNPSVSVSPSSVKPPVSLTVAANATPVKPPSVSVVPATPPKASVAASVAHVSQASTKPIQSTPANSVTSVSVNIKPNTGISKAETAPIPSGTTSKLLVKHEEPKSNVVKVEKPDKIESVKVEKTVDVTKSEKTTINASPSAPKTPVNKQTESKSKQNTLTPNQSTSQEKDIKGSNASCAVKSQTDHMTKTPVTKVTKTPQPSTPASNSIEARVKRNRFKTIPYQSPTPEIELVSKISANEAINAHKKKVEEDKLTLFYKNEFLAVRNADGGFFLCQAMYNVYKSSPKIRIRWLSEEATNKNIYGLDFYDSTDIECVLTSVSLNKIAKGKFELTQTESDRIQNILKKALDVEKGIVDRQDVTEENPDGLDLSLYKDESQIEKKTSGKRKAGEKADSAKKSSPAAKKRKFETAKTPVAKVKSNAKASKSASKSAKKTPAKNTPTSEKKKSETQNSDAMDTDVQSTPTTKRVATKRKLVNETTEVQNEETDLKKDLEASKDGEPETKVSKVEDDSPKQSSDKATESSATSTDDAAEQSSRPTRRSKN